MKSVVVFKFMVELLLTLQLSKGLNSRILIDLITTENSV